MKELQWRHNKTGEAIGYAPFAGTEGACYVVMETSDGWYWARNGCVSAFFPTRPEAQSDAEYHSKTSKGC